MGTLFGADKLRCGKMHPVQTDRQTQRIKGFAEIEMAAASAPNSNNDLQVKALKHYVRESAATEILSEIKNVNGELKKVPINTKTISERIQEIVDRQDPLTAPLTVYRGQPPPHYTISAKWWFSTSTSKKIVREGFISKNDGCCVFTIYVQPGVKVLDVNEFLKPHGGTRHDNEKEYIIDRGGFFYQDEAQTVEGFRENGYGNFTTYYFPTHRAVAAVAPVAFAEVIPNNATTRVIENIYNIEKNLISSAEDLRNSILMSYRSPSNAERFSLEKVKAVYNRKKGTRRGRRQRRGRRHTRRA